MTIIKFAEKMQSKGWKPSGGWKPEEVVNVSGAFDAEFVNSAGKLMFVRSNTILTLDIKKFDEWIKRTEKQVYASIIAQIF